MKFTKAALHAILLLGLFQQAAADNAVIVTIGEMADNKVFMEWSGSLAVLPLTPVATSSPPSRQGIFSSTGRTYFNALPIGTAVPCYDGGSFAAGSPYQALVTESIFFLNADFRSGNSFVDMNSSGRICTTPGYELETPITGCLVFNNMSFATMGSGIANGVTSTVSWNIGGTGGTQSITFVANQSASASPICFPPPVAPPVAPPVEPPIEPPVAPPIEPPVAPPIEPPVAPPVVPPVVPPVAPPVAPPVTPPVEPPVAPPVEPPVVIPAAPVASPVAAPSAPVPVPVAAPTVVAPVAAPVKAPLAPVAPPTAGGFDILAILLAAIGSIIGIFLAIIFWIW